MIELPHFILAFADNALALSRRARNPSPSGEGGRRSRPGGVRREENALEHVPEKLNDFSDKNMLQLIDLERFPFDRVIPPDRKTL
ncbi:MAG: hypothetical protein ACYC5H_07405 [Methylovirgula sp.]